MSTLPESSPSDLHAQIMNLPCRSPQTHAGYMSAYNAGHRDARHAAAELVCAALASSAPTVAAVEVMPDLIAAADKHADNYEGEPIPANEVRAAITNAFYAGFRFGSRTPAPAAPQQPAPLLSLERYDAGLLSDHGGGNVDWWWDYIRAELARAHDFYEGQVASWFGGPPDEASPAAGADQQPDILDSRLLVLAIAVIESSEGPYREPCGAPYKVPPTQWLDLHEEVLELQRQQIRRAESGGKWMGMLAKARSTPEYAAMRATLDAESQRCPHVFDDGCAYPSGDCDGIPCQAALASPAAAPAVLQADVRMLTMMELLLAKDNHGIHETEDESIQRKFCEVNGLSIGSSRDEGGKSNG